MLDSSISIWKPLEFDEKWLETSTTKLDNLLPSWHKKREQLKQDIREYEKFLNRLKRQHAIETGVIERLYDMKEGITETFIKEGFVESYIQHGDTNISPTKLMKYLNDHFEAIDFVFNLVKENRAITKSFILELHQLITSHQDYSEAIDSLGNIVQVELLRGQFKKHENNPKRSDGVVFLYCPPVHVESEIDKLLDIYYMLEERKVHPIIKAAWFHHGFVQIHPFQDGNGRMARLLASLILIKNDLFPFTVNRVEKKRYIDGLETADKGVYQFLVDFFSETQIRNIEHALNLKPEPTADSFKQVVKHFTEKVRSLNAKARQEREGRINKNRETIFTMCETVLRQMESDIQNQVGSGATVVLDVSGPYNSHYFTHQIIQYARQHDYYFNSSLFRGWFRMKFELPENKKYQLIVSMHHYGYDDSTIAIGAFMEIVTESELTKELKDVPAIRKNNQGTFFTAIPLEIRPLTMSVEVELYDIESSIRSFLQDAVTLALYHIAYDIQ